jgi:hypothetical protein
VHTIIQIIETHWTKKSRGAPAASSRNAIPELLPIPDSILEYPALLHHTVFSERTNFLPDACSGLTCFLESDSTKWRVCVVPAERGLEVQFLGTPFAQTTGRATDTIFLEENTWLQHVSNRRISQEDGWAYRKYVYNIFYGRGSEVNSQFTSTAPVIRLNHETQLW